MHCFYLGTIKIFYKKFQIYKKRWKVYIAILVMSELDIIIPIYKEGKNIRLLLDQFQKHLK